MDVFAVRFHPWGLSRFSQKPMCEMLDRVVDVDEALGEWGASLIATVQESDKGEHCAKLADALLVNALDFRADKAESIDILVKGLVNSGKPLQAMAHELARSTRTANRVWREVVGISPRSYAKLMRFHRALELINNSQALAAVAADCGFADQAHMARQIKQIAGLPPSRLRAWLGEEVYQDLYATRPAAPWKPT